MATQQKNIAQNPLILRCHRLIEAFAKSDDERDFYLDRQEGFLVFVDLDKSQEEIDELLKELKANSGRYSPIPKLTFYEIKKVMEGFVNEKVYDIDTKEKLLDIIQSKEAKENFLEFIYDHHTELEKWQQFYQERFRVRIIEWLRNNQLDFVFEEDLEMAKSIVEKLKLHLFNQKVTKDLVTHRKALAQKAKTYYSSEALNPRPKRGRPPKQVAKVETEPQFSQDIYTTIPRQIKPFVFAPDYHGAFAIFTFSGKFTSEEDLLAHRKQMLSSSVNMDLQNLQQKLAALRSLSSGWDPTSKTVPEYAFELNSAPKAQKKGRPVPPPKTAPPTQKKVARTQAATPAKKKLLMKAATKKKEKKSPAKARLRPLTKKPAQAVSSKPKSLSSKTKSPPLRKLRRAKKK